MKKTLLFVPYQYPVIRNETFIENEILLLKPFFSKIRILPARLFYNICFKKNLKSFFYKKMFVDTERKISFSSFFHFSLCLLKLLNISFRNNFYLSIKHLPELIKDAIKVSIFYSLIRDKKIKEDIIYTYWKSESTVALILLRHEGLIDSKIISRAHGGDVYYTLKGKEFRPFDQIINKYIDKIFIVSEFGYNHLIKRGFEKSKLHISKLGVKAASSKLYLDYDKIYSDFTIVSCSEINSNKRVILIAEALKNILYKIHWIHFGDGPMRYLIEDEIKNINKENKNIIIDIKGYVPNSEVLNFYSKNFVDLFVNVSESEGIPVSIMEAMSYGIPCLVTNTGGNTEIVSSFNGYIVKRDITARELSLELSNIIENRFDLFLKRRKSYMTIKDAHDLKNNYLIFAKELIKI